MESHKQTEYLRFDINFLLGKLKEEEGKVEILTDLADKWRIRATELEDLFSDFIKSKSS